MCRDCITSMLKLHVTTCSINEDMMMMMMMMMNILHQHSNTRQRYSDKNEILHIESLAGCNNIFQTASKLVQSLGGAGCKFSLFPLTLVLASSTAYAYA